MAFAQLSDWEDKEVVSLIEVLETKRARATEPVIAAYVDLALCASYGSLYRRYEAAGDHDAALDVLRRFADSVTS